MSLSETHRLVREAIRPLVGLPVGAVYRAADMLILHFGIMRKVEGGEVGKFGLHVSAPWRLEDHERIITGRYDRWHDPVTLQPAYHGPQPKRSLWDVRIAEWWEGEAAPPLVLSARADRHANLRFGFSNGTVLRTFSDGTQTEDWRLFEWGSDDTHFVITGGKIEVDE